MAALRQEKIECVLVSSGAVAEGIRRLGWKTRPHQLYQLQAAAAVGQMGLIQVYESFFKEYQLHTAQILLTHDDLSSRKRYLNARSTLRHLLDLNVIPVVNENDTVVTDEIRFGDNDTLAALVANLVEADLLLILTDQEGMYNADPRTNPSASLLDEVYADDTILDAMASSSKGALGRGGMLTKLRAARLAARSATATIIASGHYPNVLQAIFQGQSVGTLLLPREIPLIARKQWLAGHLQMQGHLLLDAGAVNSLKNSGGSLLAVGVKQAKGNFKRGDVVACLDSNGDEIARGLINYNRKDTLKILGKSSYQFEAILGYADEEELIHRDNLVLL
jgi:glutamate 5-kinase